VEGDDCALLRTLDFGLRTCNAMDTQALRKCRRRSSPCVNRVNDPAILALALPESPSSPSSATCGNAECSNFSNQLLAADIQFQLDVVRRDFIGLLGGVKIFRMSAPAALAARTAAASAFFSSEGVMRLDWAKVNLTCNAASADRTCPSSPATRRGASVLS